MPIVSCLRYVGRAVVFFTDYHTYICTRLKRSNRALFWATWQMATYVCILCTLRIIVCCCCGWFWRRSTVSSASFLFPRSLFCPPDTWRCGNDVLIHNKHTIYIFASRDLLYVRERAVFGTATATRKCLFVVCRPLPCGCGARIDNQSGAFIYSFQHGVDSDLT